MVSMAESVKTKKSKIPPRKTTQDPCCVPEQEAEISSLNFSELADVFAALGDPARLRIYWLIAKSEETCSCHLEGPLGKSQSTISHHTSRLAQAGLIVGERRGRWTWWKAVDQAAEALGLRRLIDA